jgi:hypothetical protein
MIHHGWTETTKNTITATGTETAIFATAVRPLAVPRAATMVLAIAEIEKGKIETDTEMIDEEGDIAAGGGHPVRERE